MSLRLLSAGGAFGLFGKLPGAGDFLRLNIGAAASTLDGWLERGFTELETQDADWRDGFAGAPVWRLAADAGVAGPEPLAGVMAPSRDASGRAFPCLAVAPMSGFATAALAAATGWFDAVEAALRSAVAGELSPPSLCAGLEALGPLPASASQDFVVKSRSTPDATFVDVGGGPEPGSEALNVALEIAPPPPGSSLWWRRDGRRTRVVTAVGLPRGAAFAALFHVAPPATVPAAIPVAAVAASS